MLGAQTVGLGCDKEVDAFVYYESVVEITAVKGRACCDLHLFRGINLLISLRWFGIIFEKYYLCKRYCLRNDFKGVCR